MQKITFIRKKNTQGSEVSVLIIRHEKETHTQFLTTLNLPDFRMTAGLLGKDLLHTMSSQWLAWQHLLK